MLKGQIMHPIIVAVDFSNTSVHALEYSIVLANRFNSDIVMIWVDKPVSNEAIYPDTSNENRNEAKKRFDELVGYYSKSLVKGIKIEYKLRKGKIYHEIDTLAKTLGASMIVAGAHGNSGYEEFWIGSNAFKIVTYASYPIITIRNDYPVRDGIDKILVPIDSSLETLQKIPIVAKLAGLFNSEVHLVATHYTHLKSVQKIALKYAERAEHYLQKNNVKSVTDEIVANDITKTIISYGTQMEADIIAIMTEKETPANILLGPHAQQLINQSLIPVLSLHPQEHFCL
jgi:nucleotide-binding universal stress UspA family protein